MPATQIIVRNATELSKAIKGVKGGETILLAPGNYGNFAFTGAPASTVIIKSLNPDNDAVFQSLKLTRAVNFRIEDIDINNPQVPGALDKALIINLSENVSFVGIDIAGSKDNNAWNDGYGAFITYSKNVSILDSTFVQTHIAVVASATSNLVIAGNDISQSREGVQVGQITHGLFDRNYLHDMNPTPTDHADFFQVHAGGVSLASSDLTFTNNVLIQGEKGLGIHGIFIRSEKASLGVIHTDIVVANNYYSGAALHGVSVSDARNVQITGNTALYSGNGYFKLVAALNIENLDGAVVRDNIASVLSTKPEVGNRNLTWSNNIDVWDVKFKKGAALADVFDQPAGTGEIDFASLAARTGGPANGAGFHAVAGIGHIAGTSDALLAAYAPQQWAFDTLQHHAI